MYLCPSETPQKLRQEWNLASAEEDRDAYIFLANREALDCFVRDRPIKRLGAAGGRLILADAVQEFDENLSHGEDTKFLYRLLFHGASITVLRRDWYCYRMHKKQSSKTESVKMRQSMHKCQDYMREHEEAAGRIENAAVLEGKMLTSLAVWYAESKRIHDTDSLKFLKETEKRERSRTYYPQAPLSARLSFSLAFHFTPLYWIAHSIWPYMEKLSSLASR